MQSAQEKVARYGVRSWPRTKPVPRGPRHGRGYFGFGTERGGIVPPAVSSRFGDEMFVSTDGHGSTIASLVGQVATGRRYRLSAGPQNCACRGLRAAWTQSASPRMVRPSLVLSELNAPKKPHAQKPERCMEKTSQTGAWKSLRDFHFPTAPATAVHPYPGRRLRRKIGSKARRTSYDPVRKLCAQVATCCVAVIARESIRMSERMRHPPSEDWRACSRASRLSFFGSKL